MTPATFTKWLAEMQSAGRARSDADCARQLGVHVNTIVNWKTTGVPEAASTRTALACRALLHCMDPYK